MASVSHAEFRASDFTNDGKYHLLLAGSGSVATIKIPNIINGLADAPSISIRVILTTSAREFLQGQSHEQPTLETIAKLPNVDGINLDEDEWRPTWTRGAPILHIELRRWAHALVIAPLSANTLAKIAHGYCDNLLTSTIRAWEVAPSETDSSLTNGDTQPLPVQPRSRQKPIIVAPSMNTAMWENPLTTRQLSLLGRGSLMHWIEVLRPIEKTIACGDTGNGAMREWTDIVNRISQEIEKTRK